MKKILKKRPQQKIWHQIRISRRSDDCFHVAPQEGWSCAEVLWDCNIGILLHPKKLENGKASCQPFKDLLIHFGFFTMNCFFSSKITFGIHGELGQFVRVPNIFSIDRSSLGVPSFFFESPLTMELHSFHGDTESFPSKIWEKNRP